jgi:hypothetical protein
MFMWILQAIVIFFHYTLLEIQKNMQHENTVCYNNMFER